MNNSTSNSLKGTFSFLFWACLFQTITYFVAGLLSSSIFNYKEMFDMPIIRDYFKPFGSIEIYAGPVLQMLRGLLFGLILLPLRNFLRNEKLGWLWLWLIFAGIATIGAPAAAPASMEGVIYSKLPLWFHFVGLPEIFLQTLGFSVLIHNYLRDKDHPLPNWVQKGLKALVASCIAFLGYTLVSLIFAFTSSATTPNTTDLRMLGLFIAPLVFIFGAMLVGKPGTRILTSLVLFVLSVISLGLYQGLILDGVNWLYVITAPVLPVIIAHILARRTNTEARHQCAA